VIIAGVTEATRIGSDVKEAINSDRRVTIRSDVWTRTQLGLLGQRQWDNPWVLEVDSVLVEAEMAMIESDAIGEETKTHREAAKGLGSRVRVSAAGSHSSSEKDNPAGR
jgi:hypothetical protein